MTSDETARLTRRTRTFGWGYSFTPTGEDAYSIEAPAGPDYVGTINQVLKAKNSDRTFNNRGGAFYNQQYFLNGRQIVWDFDTNIQFDMLLDGLIDEMEVTLE